MLEKLLGGLRIINFPALHCSHRVISSVGCYHHHHHNFLFIKQTSPIRSEVGRGLKLQGLFRHRNFYIFPISSITKHQAQKIFGLTTCQGARCQSMGKPVWQEMGQSLTRKTSCSSKWPTGGTRQLSDTGIYCFFLFQGENKKTAWDCFKKK